MIGQRLKELRLKKGLTLQQVGDLFGIKRSSVAGWERNESHPSLDKLPKLAKTYGTTIEYLLTGGFLYAKKAYEINESKGQYYTPHQNKVPVISWEQAAIWGEASAWEPDEKTQFMACARNYNPGTFALEVTGISMEPRFSEGDTVFVDPSKVPSHKKFVVAQFKGEPQAVLRQLMIEENKHFLCVLNTNMPVQRYVPVDEDTRICGVVIGKWRDE